MFPMAQLKDAEERGDAKPVFSWKYWSQIRKIFQDRQVGDLSKILSKYLFNERQELQRLHGKTHTEVRITFKTEISSPFSEFLIKHITGVSLFIQPIQ
jgi:hypothetical protein